MVMHFIALAKSANYKIMVDLRTKYWKLKTGLHVLEMTH